jgi:exonuclease V gamma subunit
MTAQELRTFVDNSETSHFEITYKEDVVIYKLSRYGAWKVEGNSKTRSKVAKRKYKAYIRTDVNGFYFGYASKRKARTWYPIDTQLELDKIESIKGIFKKESTLTQEEINVKACKSFLSRCHKNLWKNIQESCKAYIENKNEKDLPDFIRWTAGNVSYVSIKNKIPYNQDQIILELKNSIETNAPYKQKFRASAPQGRDRSFSIEIGDDGMTRGFFSSEYFNCLNGDYYLLISPTTALYYERD